MWENWDSEALSDLPKIILMGPSRVKLRSFNSKTSIHSIVPPIFDVTYFNPIFFEINKQHSLVFPYTCLSTRNRTHWRVHTKGCSCRNNWKDRSHFKLVSSITQNMPLEDFFKGKYQCFRHQCIRYSFCPWNKFLIHMTAPTVISTNNIWVTYARKSNCDSVSKPYIQRYD